MAPYVTSKVKLLLLSGPTAEAIENAVKSDPDYKQNCPEIVRVDCLEKAITVAHEKAVSGDIVTLSPACASFDAFPNFAARGKFFKEKVMELK